MAKKKELNAEEIMAKEKADKEAAEKKAREERAKAKADNEKERAEESARMAAADKKKLEDENAKIAAAEQSTKDKLLETPLSEEERKEYERLETLSNDGKNMPAPSDMLRLRDLRVRAKLS